MSDRIYTGSAISDLIALIEKRICHEPGCERLGRPCLGCGTYFCMAHSEKCTDCGELSCLECVAFHQVYCEIRDGGPACNSEDPVHDYRRDAVRRVQSSVTEHCDATKAKRTRER